MNGFTHTAKESLMSPILKWSIFVAMAGFLFGFDTAVISGADRPVQELWGLSDLQHGLFIMSMALWGTVLGAIFGNWPTDRLGRRKTLFAIGVLYFVSAVGSALATDPFWFSFFRLIGGFGVGMSSVAAPAYISEIAPAERRGNLVALYQFNVVFGIFMAYVSNAILGSLLGDDAWRWMVGIEAVPALVYTLALFKVPESPRWLILNRHDTRGAAAVLRQIDAKRDVDAQIEEIQAADREDNKVQSRFFSRRYRLPITLAFLIAFFNQFTGINFVLYYAPRILESAQLGASASLLSTAGIGLVMVIFTMIGMALIDRFGRRKLMYIGSVGYIISLSSISHAFFTDNLGGALIPLQLCLFVAAHGISQGTVIWVFISEIFPNRERARGQSLGSFTHWFFAAAITLVTPWVLGVFNGGPVFAFFGVMMVLQVLFVAFLMPETKGVPLEKLQRKLFPQE
ncbi:sugar porter family MFS transporter [Chromohalobacter canadensis]|uniref:Sugar porter family MFS transporter n=1 Tax=Chromohalobacter canadensis TaxID=141389 RepID=A0ABZ0Y8A8_9GAMM|nr:sugar porter family MFS transporter [Chromohalobacter canadensis]WQH07819.1 sugar porter family MFS transporter [Chromohalobacter canadensis]